MSKGYLESKTLIISALTGVLAQWEPAQKVMSDSPELVGLGVGLVFAILRLITSKKVR
jgi:hypothetical protein